jgi:hypothetical protein
MAGNHVTSRRWITLKRIYDGCASSQMWKVPRPSVQRLEPVKAVPKCSALNRDTQISRDLRLCVVNAYL